MPHRIPDLTAIAETLAGLAQKATELGEMKLANQLVEAMLEAQNRTKAIASSSNPDTET